MSFLPFFQRLAKRRDPSFWIALLILGLVFGYLGLANFPFGTWLIGWDNLLPEFNFPLNIWRAFSATWQENQGTGHLGGHGHAATLWHSVTLYLLHFIVPLPALRPLFALLMLFGGGFGAFFLCRWLLKKYQGKNWAAVLAALFYVLNLSTIQQFFTPLESFLIFHGLLPWILLSFFSLWRNFTRKNILIFFFLNAVFSSIGFLPPLFVVYSLCLGLILLAHVLADPRRKSWYKAVLIVLMVFITNAYWFLPSVYFTFTSSSVYLNSLNNKLSTTGFNLESISEGGLLDVMLLRGFVFWAKDSSPDLNGQPVLVMQSWVTHFSSPLVQGVAVTLFVVGIMGICWQLVRRKQQTLFWCVFLMFLFTFTSLAQRVLPFSVIAALLKEVPVINQAFRAAFTKVSVPLSLSYALLLGYGFCAFVSISHQRVKNASKILFFTLLATAVLFLGWPAFQGKIFSQQLKNTVPPEYLALFSFFNTEVPPAERIALFPLPDHWGWNVYTWGNTGSGFYWYALEQPFLDRAYDSWSSNNENFYNQANYALYSKDFAQLALVLKKYQVSWIILDEYLTLPGEGQKNLNIEPLKQALTNESLVLEKKQFGKLTAYHLTTGSPGFISAPETYTRTHSDFAYLTKDQIFTEEQYFIETPDESTVYPFAQLYQNRPIDGVSLSSQHVQIEKNIPHAGQYKLVLPGFSPNEVVSFETTLVQENDSLRVMLETTSPSVEINGKTFQQKNTVPISLPFTPKIGESFFLQIGNSIFVIEDLNQLKQYYLGIIDLPLSQNFAVRVYPLQAQAKEMTSVLQNEQVKNCSVEKSESVVSKSLTKNGFVITGKNSTPCFSYLIGDLNESPQVVTLRFEYRSDQSIAPDICISREQDQQRVCYNSIPIHSQSHFQDWQSFETAFLLPNQGKYWIDIKHHAESPTNLELSGEYRNIAITNQTSKFEQIIDKKLFSSLVAEKIIDLGNLQQQAQISISQPTNMLKWSISQDDYLSQANNCDVQKRGNVSIQRQGSNATFLAENGAVSCHSITFPQADSQKSYLLTVSGNHEEGGGMNINVRNFSTGKNDLSWLLSEKNYTQIFPLAPWPKREQNGYSVDLSSFSYPYLHSVNTVTDISLTEFPIEWASKVKLVTSSEVRSEKNQSIVEVRDQTKIGTALYFAKVNVRSENGLIALSQGFDNGWIAFDREELFSLLPHFKYNNWANAWLVPPGEHMIIILYWPQLLSWLGYVLLAGTGVRLLVAARRRTLKKPESLQQKIRRHFFP